MRLAHFYSLPRAVQHRFVESTRGMGAPAPLLVKLAKTRVQWLWGAGAVLLTAVWIWFATLGYGDLESSLAIAPLPVLAVHILFALSVAFSALTAQSKSWVSRQTPFATGTFLFPSGVIVASLSRLKVYPLEEVQDVSANGTQVQIRFPGQNFGFVAADAAQASAVASSIQKSREDYQRAKTTSDIRQLLLLDPLQDSGVPNPLAPSEPWAAPVLIRPWLLVVSVALSGLVLGWAVFWMRNTWSAKALYAAAVAQDTTTGYQAYLERGGKRPEVEAILLPRAELRDAQAKKTVEAIEQYIKEHPKTRIAPEITAAHRTALLAALERAKKAGTLTALRELEKKHEGYPLIQAELAQAKQAIYDKVLADFKAQAGSSPDVVPFIEWLIQYCRAHGPTVEIRFRPKYTQNYEQIEEVVKKSPYFTGPTLLPGQYFRGEYVLTREKRVGDKVRDRLQQAFPKEVLDFQIGKQYNESSGDLPKVKVPTLFIEHSVTFSGGFVGIKRQGMYMGMTLAYLVMFNVPGQQDEPLTYRLRLWRAPKQELIDEAKDPKELYENMADDAYTSFTEKFLEFWFKNP